MAISKIGRNATDTSISDSGDANAIVINSNESVGIGSAVTTSDLNIGKGLNSNYTGIQFTSPNTATGTILNFGDSTDNDYSSITAFASNAGENGRMRFIAGTSEGMNIDGSGRVTKALTPYFFGGRGAGAATSGDFVSNVAQTNTGNHYNTSTGKFTAPVAGRYYCMFGNFVSPSNTSTGHYQVSLRVNSSSTKFFYFGHEAGYHSPIHFSDIITLAANDTVCHHLHGNISVYGSDWTYATQAFYLLG